MRPLFHPSVEDVTVETILHALSDPVRVAIFIEVVGAACPQNCSNFLEIIDRPLPKSTLSQHLKVLREAGLIRGERKGVEMHHLSRCAEMDKRFPGLIASIVSAHNIQSQSRKRSRRASISKPRSSSNRASAGTASPAGSVKEKTSRRNSVSRSA